MLKKILFVCLVLSLILPANAIAEICPKSTTTCTQAPPTFYPGTNTQVTAGDILISTDTTSYGITGHSGIVTHDLQVTHIRGIGKRPEKITLTEFLNDYKDVTILRLNNQLSNWRSIAYNAGLWASNYAKYYSHATYSISIDLLEKNNTYCSKIVWQSYWYGSGYDLVTKGKHWGIVTPYSFEDDVILSKVGYIK